MTQRLPECVGWAPRTDWKSGGKVQRGYCLNLASLWGCDLGDHWTSQTESLLGHGDVRAGLRGVSSGSNTPTPFRPLVFSFLKGLQITIESKGAVTPAHLLPRTLHPLKPPLAAAFILLFQGTPPSHWGQELSGTRTRRHHCYPGLADSSRPKAWWGGGRVHAQMPHPTLAGKMP